ncbi:MAG: hypothetical protein OEZ32_09645 [Nitrospinota bacterium]|nr:hypothetical protein [Nitrospinota bacterium]
MPWYGAGPVKWDGLFSVRLFTTWWRTLADPKGLVAEALAEDYKKIIHPIPLFLFWLVLSTTTLIFLEMTRPPEYWNYYVMSLSDESFNDLYIALDYMDDDYETDWEKGGYQEVERGMSKIMMEKAGSITIDGLITWLEKDKGASNLSEGLRYLWGKEDKYSSLTIGVELYFEFLIVFISAFMAHIALNKNDRDITQALHVYLFLSAFWGPIFIVYSIALRLAGYESPSKVDDSMFLIFGMVIPLLLISTQCVVHFSVLFRISHGAGILRTLSIGFMTMLVSIILFILVCDAMRFGLGLDSLFSQDS